MYSATSQATAGANAALPRPSDASAFVPITPTVSATPAVVTRGVPQAGLERPLPEDEDVLRAESDDEPDAQEGSVNERRDETTHEGTLLGSLTVCTCGVMARFALVICSGFGTMEREHAGRAGQPRHHRRRDR